MTNLWANRLIGDAKKMAALGVSYNGRNGVISKWPAWVLQDAPPADAPVIAVAVIVENAGGAGGMARRACVISRPSPIGISAPRSAFSSRRRSSNGRTPTAAVSA